MRRTLVAMRVAVLAFPAAARGDEDWLQPEPLSQAGTSTDAAAGGRKLAAVKVGFRIRR